MCIFIYGIKQFGPKASLAPEGAFHLRRLADNVAGKLGNAYLRYQIH